MTESEKTTKAEILSEAAQKRFLDNLGMIDEETACALLAPDHKADERICLHRDGLPFYPLFQFDQEAGRVYPVLRELNAFRPDHWSDLRFCYWLTRAHADFGRAPADLLGEAPEAVVEAFRRAIEPEIHG